jgi:hypothetical protein
MHLSRREERWSFDVVWVVMNERWLFVEQAKEQIRLKDVPVKRA